MLGRVRHRNVVALLALAEAKGGAHSPLVMRRAEHGDLADFLACAPPAPVQAVRPTISPHRATPPCLTDH